MVPAPRIASAPAAVGCEREINAPSARKGLGQLEKGAHSGPISEAAPRNRYPARERKPQIPVQNMARQLTSRISEFVCTAQESPSARLMTAANSPPRVSLARLRSSSGTMTQAAAAI